MDARLRDVAQRCLEGAEDNAMTFPEVVKTLMQEGFESYAVDFRRASAIYYRDDGDSIELPTHRPSASIAPELNSAAIQSAIRDAQNLVPGYTYAGFCKKVMEAGCAGYIVSFSGRRAVYFGRTAETHVEHFPR
jgi:uncharacterized protein YbcV (DUF1398 family)